MPFIILLFGLFATAGGIMVDGRLAGTPKTNALILLVGTLMASWIGTTGAAMLLIRPLIRINAWRRHVSHIMVFLIFLVANMAGVLRRSVIRRFSWDSSEAYPLHGHSS